MKDKIRKWMKYNWAAVWLVIAVFLLAVSGSFAAYTSFNSVKRVVSTGKRNSTLFSSNYLSLVKLNEETYSTRHISPGEVKNGDTVSGYTFTVQVCNYIIGNKMTYNPSNITYTFEVKVLAKGGGSLPEGIDDITINSKTLGETGTLSLGSQTLSNGAASEKGYQFRIPAGLKDQVKFQIAATPDSSSQEAVNNQKLAAILTLSSLTPTENWTGRFLDNKNVAADQYDAYNYEISGNGSGRVTLSWPQNLQVSSWFLTDVNASVSGNSCTFAVGGDTTAYQFQFFRNPGTENLSWEGLENSVTVSFQP